MPTAPRGPTGRAAASGATIADLDTRIAALEEQITSDAAEMRAEGLSARVVAAAMRRMDEQLAELEAARDRAVKVRRRLLVAEPTVRRLGALAEAAEANLLAADADLRRRIVELIDAKVQVTGWVTCPTCSGKCKLALPDGRGPSVRGEVRPPQPRRSPPSCPDCACARRHTTIAVSGSIPELLLDAIGRGQIIELPDRSGGLIEFDTRRHHVA